MGTNFSNMPLTKSQLNSLQESKTYTAQDTQSESTNWKQRFYRNILENVKTSNGAPQARTFYVTHIKSQELLVVHKLLLGGNILETAIIDGLTSAWPHSHGRLLQTMLPLGVHQGRDTAHLAHCKLPLVRQHFCSRKTMQRRYRWKERV